MPEWTHIDPQGNVRRRPVTPPEFQKEMQEISNKNGLKLYGMASNYADGDFDPVRMALSMKSEAARRSHAKALAKIAVEDKLDGIDLDYENMKAGDRENYSLLVEAIAKELHRVKKRLSVTVHAKLSEPGSWDAVIAHDWKRLGNAADEFRVMTYDQHWATSEPGPIASDEWVENVMKFAVAQVPAKKVWMGVATYGYDWSKKPATSLTWSDVSTKSDWTIDPTSGEMVSGKTWFGGPESAMRKREIAIKHKLAGFAVWYIGSEKPSTWRVLTGDFE